MAPHPPPVCLPLEQWRANATALTGILWAKSLDAKGAVRRGWAKELDDPFAYQQLFLLYIQLNTALRATPPAPVGDWIGGGIPAGDIAGRASWLAFELAQAASLHDPIPGWLPACSYAVAADDEAEQLFRRVREALDV